MLATTIRAPPSVEDYTALAEYESQTPESFADGKPVLHFHLQRATASVPRSQCGRLAVFPADAPAADGARVNGEADGEAVVEQEVDVFVGSESFTIFSQQAQAGVSIPYPSISIHAVKDVGVQALWMQLEFSDGGAEDDDFGTVELTITPPSRDDATPGLTQQLYDAVSACSDLHPDAGDDSEDDEGGNDCIVFEAGAEAESLDGFMGILRGSANGGLPPPMPGSGGWITADNAHDFFDEEGNWLGRDGGELGEGAGRVRPHDELEPEGVNGQEAGLAAEDPDSKRPRVD